VEAATAPSEAGPAVTRSVDATTPVTSSTVVAMTGATPTSVATASVATASTLATLPVEAPEDAVRRLAEGRALAFDRATVQALTWVDEPGSPAMTADAALIGRLGTRGLRLQGLRFEISEVRVVSAPAGSRPSGLPGTSPGRRPVVLEATVVTSGHRQVGVRDGVVRASVPASPPRRVLLTLVPAPDGRHWLVRAAEGTVPS
jgi:hypothetical protein